MAAQPDALAGLPWRKSSASGEPNVNCVEVAPYDVMIMVRDSCHPHKAVLGLSRVVWADLIGGLRDE
ncbi:hypothetical protein GCM10022221_21820 [Actinocorallia aurea]